MSHLDNYISLLNYQEILLSILNQIKELEENNNIPPFEKFQQIKSFKNQMLKIKNEIDKLKEMIILSAPKSEKN